ncbi:cupin domain-containing protein [Campylobacter sp. US33a]|uniref:Cupin domain-containing protein n=1 Tax=Campylobacter sp. CCS1377 TaxID=3158229 RepID=A0AAU7E8X6_9BACT|nr:cupin domain-containing protein [Campylobacter sp. US33a]MCW1359973.1 cupin domain-containing protein [Campylobacter jejuni]TEY03160.1 cupin domain-containing protein [Campylobacter sp. US33a]
MQKITRENAKHYNWKEICDGWHFVDSKHLSIIAEKMPPHTAEDMHYHDKAEQFFYILKGKALMRLENADIELEAGEGIHIKAHQIHQMINQTCEDLEFIVVSCPKSHNDKFIVK